MKQLKIKIMMIFIVGVSNSAFSQEGVRLGNTFIFPFVETELTYDDNIFQEANAQDDIYWQYGGGLRLMQASDSMSFDSSAWVTQRQYDEYSEKDSDRWGLAGALGLFSDKSRGSAGFDVRQVDDYDDAPAYGKVPAGFEGVIDQAFDRTTSNQRRLITDVNLGAGQQLSDNLDLSFAYSFYQVDYDDDAFADWYENGIGTELSFKLTDKSVSFLNGQYARQDGDGAPDNGNSSTLRVGLKNSLTDKSTIRAGVGVMYYENNNEDYLKPSFDVLAQWASTDKILIFVNGRNEFQPSETGATVKIATRASTGIRYQLFETLGFILSGALVHDEDQGAGGDKVIQKIVTCQVEYIPVDQLNLFVSAEGTDGESDVSEDYDRFRGTAGMKYMF